MNGLYRLGAGALVALGMFGSGASGRAAGIDGDGIREAAAYSARNGGVALLIEKDGWVRHRSGRTNEPHHVRSITKSLWALAVLRAAEEGLIHLDQPVGDVLPEWRDGRGAITARQLLDMTSGLEPAASRIYGRRVPSAVRGALSAELRAAPGTRFEYGPAGYEVLGEVFRRRTGMGALGYMEDKVLRPAGIGDVEFTEDRSGHLFWSAGANMSAEQLLDLGRILMREGRGSWGRKVVDAGSLRVAFAGSRSNPAYGCGFWLNRNASDAGSVEAAPEALFDGPFSAGDGRGICLAKAAPPDLTAMLGSGGQRVYVSRSWRLVVARLGDGEGFRDAEFWRRLAGVAE